MCRPETARRTTEAEGSPVQEGTHVTVPDRRDSNNNTTSRVKENVALGSQKKAVPKEREKLSNEGKRVLCFLVWAVL